MKTIKNKNRKIMAAIAVIMVIIFSGCSKNKNANQNIVTKPDNYVILLDLSDRLLAPHQDKEDIATIMVIFDEFKKKVYSKLIINSTDRFSIRVLHQKNSNIDNDLVNDILTLNMKSSDIKNKKKLLKFEKQLKNILENLYKKAKSGKHHYDYQGVDIWRYFNEYLQYDLHENYNNHLIILTDGYFDFETYNNTIRKNNRFSSTLFFKYLNRNNWKEYAQQKDFGLIPINYKFPETTVSVIGINPKNNSLYQIEKLTYFWKKWLTEMDFTNINIIPKNNSLKLQQILTDKKF